MSAIGVQQMADRVAQLMEERLRIRGKGLEAKLRHARGTMPKRVQAEAAVLAKAVQVSANPKTVMQVDHARIADAYDTCLAHLNTVGRRDRRIGLALSVLRSIAFSLLSVVALLLAVLVWRGFL